MNKGLTKNQAKGIYGNIMYESGGKHNIVSRDGHNSYGLA
nr:MAG TPA: Morphogenesis protein 1 wall, phi29, hydrolase, infection [Bacteriophage sp.]